MVETIYKGSRLQISTIDSYIDVRFENGWGQKRYTIHCIRCGSIAAAIRAWLKHSAQLDMLVVMFWGQLWSRQLTCLHRRFWKFRESNFPWMVAVSTHPSKIRAGWCATRRFEPSRVRQPESCRETTVNILCSTRRRSQKETVRITSRDCILFDREEKTGWNHRLEDSMKAGEKNPRLREINLTIWQPN